MKKTIAVIALVVLVLVCGYIVGRHHTIRQAELLDITSTDYYIGFGDEVHIYTFEEGK